MKLKFSDNYNLFVIYLLLNLSGYDDENNKRGMHPARKMVRRKFQKYNRKNKKFLSKMRGLIKRVYYSRLTQVFVLVREKYKKNKKDMYREFLEDVKEVKRMMPLIEKFEKEYKLKEFFRKKYSPYIEKIINKSETTKTLSKYKSRITGFIKSRDCEILIIPNFMESYWRGHSHFANNRKALLNIGPGNKNDNINWHNIVHESLHFLLRKYFKKVAKKFSPKLKKIIREKTLDKDYKDNPPMSQIEETFIRAFTPVITGEKLWDYTIQKFPLTELIYKELKEKLVKGKVKFNQKILGEILKKIEKTYV
jgi:hypothetical protein